MRLLFLNRSFPVLSQTFVLDQIAYAIDAGQETTVAALKLSKGVVHPVVERLKLYNTILYSRPVDARNLRRLAKGIVGNSARLPVQLQSAKRGRPTLTETAIAVQLVDEPDIIIANFGPTGISAARLKRAYFPRCKVVVVFHGYDVSGYVQKNGWEKYRRMSEWVDLAVCVNQRWAQLLRENTTMQNIVVNHLGVDCRSITRRPRRRESRREVLFVGRMTEKKGFDHLIAAVEILSRHGSTVRVHAVGNGPLLSAYQDKVRALKLEEQFIFHGEQSHGVVLSLMGEADVLVAPSVTASDGDQEGIPVVLMEGMARGIPVVSTRHSGIPELVIDGQCGLLVDEGDDAALAECISKIIADCELGERLADSANLRVREHFNAATQNSRFFRLVESLQA